MANEQPAEQGFNVFMDKYLPNQKSKEKQDGSALKNLMQLTQEERRQEYQKALEQLDVLEVEHLNIMVSEVNPQCLEKGLEVVHKYIMRKCQLLSKLELKDLTLNLLQFSYTRIQMRPKINEIFAHIFKNDHKFIIFDTINRLLAHKVPKIVQGSIVLILELLDQFGVKQMENLKPFFSSINKLIEGQQAVLKNDAVRFYKEAVRQLGEDFLPIWNNLNDKIKLELNEIAQELPKDDSIKTIRSEIIVPPLIDLPEALQLDAIIQQNNPQNKQKSNSQKQQYENEEQAQKNYAMLFQQKQLKPQRQEQELILFNQNQIQNMQESQTKIPSQHTIPDQQQNMIGSQEKHQQFELQQEKKQLDSDSPKKLLQIFGKEQKEISQIELKSQLQPLVASQQEEILSPQFEQQQSRVIQPKFDLSNYLHSKQSDLKEKLSSQKQQSDDNMKAQEQSKSMILHHHTIQQGKSSKVKNLETTYKLSNIFAGGNHFQQNSFQQEKKSPNIDHKQVSACKMLMYSKNSKMSSQKNDSDNEKYQQKYARLEEQEQIGFIYHKFSEQQWNLVKEQMIQIQLPQNLIVKMFSQNKEQHIQGISIIISQLQNIASISDLFFKWGYMISLMVNSIQIQQNVQMLFMDVIKKLKVQDQTLSQMESMLFYKNLQMVCVLLAKYCDEKLSYRLIPLIMANQLEVKKMGFQAADFLAQFPVDSQISHKALIYYRYIINCIDQYEDESKQRTVVQNMTRQINRVLPVTPSKIEIVEQDLQIRFDDEYSVERLYVEFLETCELIMKERFIYTHENLVAFLRLTFDFGTFNLSQAYMNIFFNKILLILDCISFINNLQYDYFLSLFNYLIQRIAKLNEATDKDGDIIKQHITILFKLVDLIDIHFIYNALSEILIQTRNEGIGVQYKYVSQTFAIISNKLTGFIQKKFVPTKFAEILIKISEYIELCQSQPAIRLNQIDELNLKTLQTTVNSFMMFGDTQQIEHIFNQTEINSTLREWYEEYRKKSQKQSDQTLRLLSYSLKLDFGRTFEQFVAHLIKFQYPNWKYHVSYLNPDQIRQIEDRVQQGQR